VSFFKVEILYTASSAKELTKSPRTATMLSPAIIFRASAFGKTKVDAFDLVAALAGVRLTG
jgi:hypothetical protein